MPEDSTSPPQKPKPPIRIGRIVAWFALLIAIAACAIPLYGRWKDYQRSRWERAERARQLTSLLTDAPPPGTVAFEEDNAKAQALAKSDNYTLFSHPLTQTTGARRRLLALAQFDPRLETIDGQPSTRQHSILFCHELRTQGGPPRLVVVEGIVTWETSNPGHTHLQPVATTFATDTPGPTPLRPTSESEGPVIDGQLTGEPPWAIRVFAGQVDPKDASHFSIDYQTSECAKGTIDGWLRQSSGPKGAKDEVELKLR